MFAQRGLHLEPTPWGAWVTLAANAAFLWVFHFLLYPFAPIFAVQNLTFVAVGLFVPGITRVLTFRGIRMLGSSITATIVNATPMFSTVLAMFFLRERPGPLVLLGAALIVGGLIAITWERQCGSWKKTELIFPFFATLLFGMKDVTVRWGLEGSDSPVLAAAIAALTSTAEIFFILRCAQREKFSLPAASAMIWFTASGLFTGGSFLFMYLALSMESVSVVGPLVNSYAVFVLLLAPFLARRIERVTARKTAGAALVVLGTFLISAAKD